MKILQINCVYKNGSTGKIVEDIHNCLIEKGVNSVVCYGRGRKEKGDNVYKVCSEFASNFNHLISRVTGNTYGGYYGSLIRIKRIIKKEKPDIVHLHCLNGFFVNIYRLLNYLKKNKIKTVLTLHAEFMYTGVCGCAYNCSKWKENPGCVNCVRWKLETKALFNRVSKMWVKMKDAFTGFEDNLVLVSVSPWLMERAKQSTILKDRKHYTVFNGLNEYVFKYVENDDLSKRLNINSSKIILHVTPAFDDSKDNLKGGRHVIELANKFINEDVKFIIVGRYAKDMQLPPNVILLGKINFQNELASLYSLADVTLLTSEYETFSMVTAESLCCGTPVVGFKAGGPEVIAMKEYSKFCEYGDIDTLKNILLEVLKNGLGSKEEISSMAIKQYSKKEMTENYLKIYERLIKQ